MALPSLINLQDNLNFLNLINLLNIFNTMKKKFIAPIVRRIKLDPTVSLTMMSTPPGNPGNAPGFGSPNWGNPWGR